MKELFKKYETIVYLCVIFLVIFNWFMPKVGNFVLFEETLDLIFIWIAFIYITKKLLTLTKSKYLKILLVLFCSGILFIPSKDVILDVFEGTTTQTINQVTTSKYSGPSGIISLHYYIEGKDTNNKKIKFEVSSNEYSKFNNKQQVTIEYYPHTKRVKSVY